MSGPVPAAGVKPGPKIELIVNRDPDYSTDIQVYVDGVPDTTGTVEIHSVDIGAGYTIHDIEEWIEDTTGDASISEAVKAYLLEIYVGLRDSKWLLNEV